MPAVIVDDIPSDLPTVEWEVESLMRKEGCGPLFVLRTSFFARQDSELGTTNRAAAITSQFQSAKFNFSGSLFGKCLRSSRRPLLTFGRIPSQVSNGEHAQQPSQMPKLERPT